MEVRRRGYRSLAAAYTPALLNQVLQHFEGKSLKAFVDCTVGAGSHAYEIIQAHPELETFVALDLDPAAITIAKQKLDAAVSTSGNSKLQLHSVQTNFKHIKARLTELDSGLLRRGVDGILMDLGASSMQMNNPQRGFSYYLDGPLDMRMDPTDNFCWTAATIINCWNERELGRLLRGFGEEQRWKSLARQIVETRPLSNRGLKTTLELVKLIGGKEDSVPHPAASTFQALRIGVNDELTSLKVAIPQAVSCLAAGGRLAVISSSIPDEKIINQMLFQLLQNDDFTPPFKLLATIDQSSSLLKTIDQSSLQLQTTTSYCKLQVLEKKRTEDSQKHFSTNSVFSII